MAVLKYKDEDGFWQELPVGTKVVANPGGGKLYAHNITISEAFRLTFTVYRPTNKKIESIDEIVELNNEYIPAAYDDGDVAVAAKKVSTGIQVHGARYEVGNVFPIDTIMQLQNISITDHVYEL